MNIEQFSRYSLKKRKLALEKLTPTERETLCYYWEFFARKEQLPPKQWGKNGCYLWIIRAGRGWGKTRTGAETFINKIQYGGYRYTSLCAATAAEVRDIQIKGESGILKCCPHWFMPEYRPSEKKIIMAQWRGNVFFLWERAGIIKGGAI